MRQADLELLTSPLVPGEPLRFEGRLIRDRLGDGLLCAGQSVVGYVEWGVVSLVAPNLNWPEEKLDRARKENWIGRSWDKNRWLNLPRQMVDFARELAATDGVILEVACGPGGGLTPGILLERATARVVMNDLSIGVLQLHKEFLTRNGGGSEVMMAAFDATRKCVQQHAIQSVSNCHGFASTGNSAGALASAFAALAPGGYLYSVEIVCDPDEWARLPDSFRERWAGCGVCGSWRDHVQRAGFQIESCEFVSGPLMDPNEGDLPRAAADLGTRLHKHFEYIRARKPKAL